MEQEFEFRTLEDIANRLKKFRFKKRTFGGVDEKNVWEGIGKLNEFYEEFFRYQQAGYEARLRDKDKTIRALLEENKRLKDQIKR